MKRSDWRVGPISAAQSAIHPNTLFGLGLQFGSRRRTRDVFVEDCSPDERSDIRGRVCPAYRCAHAGYMLTVSWRTLTDRQRRKHHHGFGICLYSHPSDVSPATDDIEMRFTFQSIFFSSQVS
jgi:hypothetical protein